MSFILKNPFGDRNKQGINIIKREFEKTFEMGLYLNMPDLRKTCQGQITNCLQAG